MIQTECSPVIGTHGGAGDGGLRLLLRLTRTSRLVPGAARKGREGGAR
jgi:hypothetical protein